MKFFEKLKSLGWKVWLSFFTGFGVVIGFAFKLWQWYQDTKTTKDVSDTATKKVDEAHADDKAVAVEVAKADARADVVSTKIEEVAATTAPESDARIDALTEDLAAMTRRRHAEGTKTP